MMLKNKYKVYDHLYYKNKNVLITGGAKGIGLDTALQFLKFGANVSILSKTYYKELKSYLNPIKIG